MSRRNVIELILQSDKYDKEQKEIICAIEEAREEWVLANNFFQFAGEKELIDYAIYKEDAAKSKYMYYLTKAKDAGITMDIEYMVG